MQQVGTHNDALIKLIVFCNSIENIDYIPGPYTNITIPSETLSITFNVLIMLDVIFEENEVFYLLINSSLLGDNVTAGSLSTASVVILDDDRKCSYIIYSFSVNCMYHSHYHYIQSVNIHY